MLKRLWGCGLLCMLTAVACQPTSIGEMTAEQRSAIADTVEQVARDVLDAFVEHDVDRFLALRSDDLILAGDRGWFVEDYQEYAETFRTTFEMFTEAEGSIDVMNVEVLGPNAAVLNWRLVIEMTKEDGDTFAHGGLVTAVIARRNGAWKIIREHESGFPLEEG